MGSAPLVSLVLLLSSGPGAGRANLRGRGDPPSWGRGAPFIAPPPGGRGPGPRGTRGGGARRAAEWRARQRGPAALQFLRRRNCQEVGSPSPTCAPSHPPRPERGKQGGDHLGGWVGGHPWAIYRARPGRGGGGCRPVAPGLGGEGCPEIRVPGGSSSPPPPATLPRGPRPRRRGWPLLGME